MFLDTLSLLLRFFATRQTVHFCPESYKLERCIGASLTLHLAKYEVIVFRVQGVILIEITGVKEIHGLGHVTVNISSLDFTAERVCVSEQ